MFTSHVTVMCLKYSHTISIRVGTRCVETLNPTRLTERVFRHVSVKSICGQIIWPLGQRKKKSKSHKILHHLLELSMLFTCKSLKWFPGTIKWWFCFFVQMPQLENSLYQHLYRFTVLQCNFDEFCELQTSAMVLWHISIYNCHIYILAVKNM